MGIDFAAINDTCEGCKHSKPGRKRDCEIKKALLLPESARPEFVEYARAVYGRGHDCRFRERKVAR